MRKKKQSQDDEPAGAPEWMVTFSDCMTLLLTFFVLLLSFSSFDDKVFNKLRVIFANALPSVSTQSKSEGDAFLPTDQIEPTEELDKGSEKPSLARGKGDGLKEDTEPANFHSRKVFLISSARIFWGKGTVISSQGRKTLFTIASFLREIPSRIVVSENGKGDQKSNEHFGLQRAWAVIEYLTTKQGLDRRQFSISAVSTLAGPSQRTKGPLRALAQESLENSEPDYPEVKTERMLEIVLLERSIYN